MTSGRWNDEMLDAMRQRGDDEADAVINELARDRDLAAVQGVLNSLVENDSPVPETLPPVVRAYFEQSTNVQKEELSRVALGQSLFAEHGPEILMILLFYSLPASYFGHNGVQVLYRTAYLAKRPVRRIVETCQMLIDILTPGGLEPTGRGGRSAQKVRLMHAAIRHLLLHDREHPWDTATLGIPINQEDLAGTLTPFTYAIVDGLHKLGVHPGDDAEQAYVDVWRVIGRIMGILPEMIPQNLDEVFALGSLILARQGKGSDAGRLLTEALLHAVEEDLPRACHGLPASLMRFFLPSDVADGLGIAHHPLEQKLVPFAAHLTAEVDTFIQASTHRSTLLRVFSLRLIEWLIHVDRGGQRVAFTIPPDLHGRWQGPKHGHDPTIWHQLMHWVGRRGF